MKKVLSILLIAAAAFGFYGGAVSINDVLDCKAYWEDMDKQSSESLNMLKDGLDQLHENTEAYLDGVVQVADGEKELAAGEKEYAAGLKTFKDGQKEYAAGKKTLADGKKQYAAAKGDLNALIDGLTGLPASVKTLTDGYYGQYWPGRELLAEKIAESLDDSTIDLLSFNLIGCDKAKLTNAKAVLTDMSSNDKVINGAVVDLIEQFGIASGKISSIVETVNDVPLVGSLLGKFADKLVGSKAQEMVDSIAQLKEFDAGYKTILDGQKQMKDGIKTLTDGILGADMLVTAYKKAGLLDEITKLSKTTAFDSPSFAEFVAEAENVSKLAPSAAKVAKGVKSSTVKQLTDGEAQLKAAEKQLADGAIKLKDAEKQLADGRTQLADGKKQLAQYEDGEKQIRDGLKTLMESKADGGIASIGDRIGMDEDFNLKDGNLDFDAAYNGVDQGWNYKADLKVLLERELPGRLIGHGLGIFAGLLALIAAILAFVKKNKGAGILGLLAAVAAGAGAVVVKTVGTELSVVAGSAVGVVPFAALIALTLLGAVAGIVFLASKKAA